MTKTTFLAAAAIVTSLVASPVMAQDMSQQPTSSTHQRYSHHRDFDRHAYNDHDHGFWPADVAAGVIGGAVGTAGAIATAPFTNDAYAYNDAFAYDNDDCMTDGQKAAGGCGFRHSENYAARNGFVCQPGTWVRMEDGQRHICQ